MGMIKQLLRIDGRPVLQHVLDHVCASEVGEIVLVLGASADVIRREIDVQGVRVVLNVNYAQGMGTSLKAGLSAVVPEAEAAVIVLADQPFVRTSTVNQLIEEHRRTKAQIVIPTYRGFRGNPVLLDRAVFPEVMMLSGDTGCRAIFGDHPEGLVRLPVEDVGILQDIDRQGDMEALRRAADRAERRTSVLEINLRGAKAADAAPRGPELVIVGRGPLAIALAKLAHLLRFTVTLVDPLLATDEVPEADRVLHALEFSILPANPERYVVVASRGVCDEEAIEQALQANSSYIGLVANRKRGEEVLRGMRIKGIAEKLLANVRVPAGLTIGADTPEEIALSIMAEIVSERRQQTAQKQGRASEVPSG
jgi:molybdenum cofactor cytidylyltransferase